MEKKPAVVMKLEVIICFETPEAILFFFEVFEMKFELRKNVEQYVRHFVCFSANILGP